MQAIILAAGMGKRLKKLTNNNTKCMVKVNGCSLIERMLHQLESIDLTRIIIVIGYEGKKLKDYIESLHIKTPIVYVENEVYYKTNNIYSLSMAQQYLIEDDTLLLESDLIFEDSILDILLNDERESLALVDKYESWMDGTCLKVDAEDHIREFVPGNQFKYDEASEYYKTVNIYKFSKDFSKNRYVPFLNAYTEALGNNEYYEQVLRVIVNLDNSGIHVKKLSGQKWYEIDDVQDLDIAESMFNVSSQERLDRIYTRYGGYWRYPDMIDFCYPGNPYFPPQKMKDEIMASTSRLISGYPSGMRIVKLLASKVLNIDSQYLLVTNGIEEALYCLCRNMKKVGVILPTRMELLNELKDKTVEFHVNSEDFSFTADDVIEFFSGQDINWLVLYNPNYHTGFYLEQSEIIKILEWSKKSEINVIYDESSVDFAENDTSMLKEEILEKYPNLVVLQNMSVSHGVTGIRLGCIVTADYSLRNQLEDSIPSWNIDSFAEFYLQIVEKYLSDYKKSLTSTMSAREEFINELSKVNGLKVLPSFSNFVICELLSNLTSKEVCEKLLEEHNMLIRDITDTIGRSGRQYIKIAVRTATENALLVKALEDVLSKDNERVWGRRISLNNTKDFFEKRAEKSLPHRYNYVIYQDSNPELALERDAFEKKKISPMLNLRDSAHILDIGCGVGRWGDAIVDKLVTGKYVGIDFSLPLLEIAKSNFANASEKCIFLNGSFQEMLTVLKSAGLNYKYDTILVNGVLMYINDAEIQKCLENVKKIIAENGRIYIKESVGIHDRFTLNNFYSQEMDSQYSAVYRDLNEYQELIQKIFLGDGYEIKLEGETWDEAHSNRKETTSYFWILKRM